ncbi:radical SAM protein [Actinokineospora enzanensis]|uniref:radical SAM protein n=1 Tax=Actinokineospora enzanensis TaxID=155975 RepID=UPI0003677C0D|nr:radical SAM protein [Actinokineospora enzanensis]
MTNLGMPTMPAPAPLVQAQSGPVIFTEGHHFRLNGETSVDELAEQINAPLSVIQQITKRCDFDCNFCSETLQLPDPTLDQLDTMRANLAGVQRVFLSGGEPLLRRDFGDVVDMYAPDFILGIPTNATRGAQWAERMVGKIAYVNVGLDGPRAITARLRGDWDKIMTGIRAFQEHGLPLSLSCVALRSGLHGLPYLYQIADAIDAGKLKLIMPLRKGNALKLQESEFITEAEAEVKFGELTSLAATFGWQPALRLTTWNESTEGHMICIEPTGQASAWPVYDAKNLFEPLGNVLEEPITEIWQRYRFKRNHVAKYLGTSILATQRGGSHA